MPIQSLSKQTFYVTEEKTITLSVTGHTNVAVIDNLMGWVQEFDTTTNILKITGTSNVPIASGSLLIKAGSETATIAYEVLDRVPVVPAISRQLVVKGQKNCIMVPIKNLPTAVEIKGELLGLRGSSNNRIAEISGDVPNKNFGVTTGNFLITPSNSAGTASQTTVPYDIDTIANCQPRSFTATRGNKRVTLNWTAPVRGNHAGFARYQYQINGGIWQNNGTSLSKIVTGLENGQSYSFKVAAIYGVMNRCETDAITAIPATVPSAPQLLEIVSYTQTYNPVKYHLTFRFLPPADDGGSPITNYYYDIITPSDNKYVDNSNIGNTTQYSRSFSQGLQASRLRVRAKNAIGYGAYTPELTIPSAS